MDCVFEAFSNPRIIFDHCQLDGEIGCSFGGNVIRSNISSASDAESVDLNVTHMIVIILVVTSRLF